MAMSLQAKLQLAAAAKKGMGQTLPSLMGIPSMAPSTPTAPVKKAHKKGLPSGLATWLAKKKTGGV